jgi:peptidyl-prolyl cis-trans isomerase D
VIPVCREAEADRRFYTLAERMADLAFENSGSLDPAAEALDLRVRRINDVARAAGMGLADFAEVRNAAFSPEVLEERFNSRLLELSGEHVAVVRVAEHTPSRQMQLEEVDAVIRAELIRSEARALASATAESLVERARAGEDLAALAAEVDATYHEPHVAGRADDHAPPTLLRALFRAPRPGDGGDPAVHMVMIGNAVAVYRLLGVTAGTPELMEDDQVTGITAALASRLGQAEFHALLSTLRARASISYGSNLWSDDNF